MLEKILQAVLNKAHDQHEYVSDTEQYQKAEHWTASPIGDCEDFALYCRQELKELGIESDLLFCGVSDPLGDHLVLQVDGWILDNRHKWVMNKDDLPYTWLKLGRPDGKWYEIEGA